LQGGAWSLPTFTGLVSHAVLSRVRKGTGIVKRKNPCPYEHGWSAALEFPAFTGGAGRSEPHEVFSQTLTGRGSNCQILSWTLPLVIGRLLFNVIDHSDGQRSLLRFEL
jgi:hypothetical protein